MTVSGFFSYLIFVRMIPWEKTLVFECRDAEGRGSCMIILSWNPDERGSRVTSRPKRTGVRERTEAEPKNLNLIPKAMENFMIIKKGLGYA